MLIFKNISNAVVKDVDVKSRKISGYFSAFGNVDSDNDIIMPGSYSKAIQEWGRSGKNRIQHLLQHDTYKPLGKPEILKEDSIGLYFETIIANTSYGNDTLALYESGTYDEHSVGIQVIKSSQDENTGVRSITEIKLWEGSTVTWGANENTPFTGFKSTKEEISFFAKEIERTTKALKLSGLTDETFQQFEYSLKKLESLYNTALLKSEAEAQKALTLEAESRKEHIQLINNYYQTLKGTK
jgi:hypothetical protein